ncbi:hypothetical protein PFISCL1PPCAC_9040, partial [Pristionchus fissidentatus]
LQVSGKYRALTCPEHYSLQYLDPSKGKYTNVTSINCAKTGKIYNYVLELSPTVQSTVQSARCAVPLCSLCKFNPATSSDKPRTIVDEASCKLLKCEGDDGLQISNQTFAGAAKCIYSQSTGKYVYKLGENEFDDSAEVKCVKKKPCTAKFKEMCENADAGLIKCTVQNGLPVCENNQLELDGTPGNFTCNEYDSGKYMF